MSIMNHSTTTTEDEFLNNPAMISLIFINCVISILGIIGNSFVVGAFVISTKVRTKSNFFLCSLAAADLMACLVCIPLWNFVLFTEGSEGLHNNDTVYSAYHVTLDPLFGVASIMNLLAVSFVRYWMVKRPLAFDALKNKAFAVAAFLFPWGMGVVTIFYLWQCPNFEYNTIVLVCVVYFAPLLMIMYFYSVVISTGLRHMNTNTEGFRYATMLVIVVVCFVITWAPFFCLMIINQHCEDCTFPSLLSVAIVKSLQYSNTIMNPLIYSLRSVDFRNAFKLILIKLGLCSSVIPLPATSQEEMAMSQACVVPINAQENQ